MALQEDGQQDAEDLPCGGDSRAHEGLEVGDGEEDEALPDRRAQGEFHDLGQDLRVVHTKLGAREELADAEADSDRRHHHEQVGTEHEVVGLGHHPPRFGRGLEALLQAAHHPCVCTLLNVTVNPDFSTVESDAGQLNVNKTYSLFYEEARPFFVENSDYFTSNFNLVYTRNIADPDYGAKLTGTNDNHTYGAFISHDKETNYILPGNTGSSLKSLNEESHSGAFKYRYDFSEDFSLGVISTLRKSDNYENTVAGLNTKYRINDSNALLAQVVHSNSDYSIEQTNELSDQAVKVSYEHDSEYWSVNAVHQSIGKDFRADLGYMTKADYQDERLLVDRFFYSEGDSFWQEVKLSGQWQIKHNENGELLEKSLASSFTIDGPKLSTFDIMFTYADKIGLRHNELNYLVHDSTSVIIDDSIDGNTDRFTEKLVTIFTNIKPTTYLYGELYFSFGEKIDYQNNRTASPWPLVRPKIE